MGCEQCQSYSETLIYWRAKGLANFVRYNEVSLYRGSYNCITRGERKSFVIPRTSLYRSSLHRGSSQSISSHFSASNRMVRGRGPASETLPPPGGILQTYTIWKLRARRFQIRLFAVVKLLDVTVRCLFLSGAKYRRVPTPSVLKKNYQKTKQWIKQRELNFVISTEICIWAPYISTKRGTAHVISFNRTKPNTVCEFYGIFFFFALCFSKWYFSVLYEKNTVLPIIWFVSRVHLMILCCGIFSYPSVSDSKGEFLVEFSTPERPHYVRKLLDRLSMLTEGISMVNSRLVNVR